MTKLLIPVSAAALLLTSCGNYQSGFDAPAAQRDAVSGAVIGGLAGAIIGHQSGETRNGTIIGAALGGLTGYAVGEDKDRKWQSRGHHQRPPQQQPHQPWHNSPGYHY